MTKTRTILGLIVLFLTLTSFGDSSLSPPKFSSGISYKSGERLKYTMYYGLINGGIATIDLKRVHMMGREVYHSRIIGQTTGITDKIFAVRDVYESYFDIDNGLPVKAIRDIKEGRYTFYDEVVFNHPENHVISQRKGKIDVPTGILDMVSTLYYLRRIDYNSLKIGQSIKVDTFFGDEIFPFEIRYKGKETIKTGLGSINCHKFVPIVEPGRIFKNEDDMTIWISDDANKVPVRIRFEMWVGSFKCDLIEHKNLVYNLNVKK